MKSIDICQIFRQLIFYDEAQLNLGEDTFASNLGLLTKNGQYNKIAELMSDKNHIGFIYARYNGKDKSSLSETVDFGNQCILTAVEKMKYRLEGENRGVTKISSTTRSTETLVDIDCLREAVYNAVAHNDWLNGGVPSVYVYDDRVEIISYGGLPYGQTEENFFKGISKPRSEGLIRILRDLDFAERTGHGVPQTLAKYGKGVFEITEGFILVTLPYDEKVIKRLGENEHVDGGDEHLDSKNEHVDERLGSENEHVKNSNFTTRCCRDREEAIMNLIMNDEEITYEEISRQLNISLSTVRRSLLSLKEKGILLESKVNRHGKWKLRGND